MFQKVSDVVIDHAVRNQTPLVAALTTPIWINVVSDTCRVWLPILGMIVLVTQQGAKLYRYLKRKSDDPHS